jgi:hypothetical protein
MSHKQEHANIVLIRASVGSRIFTEILSEWLQLRGFCLSPAAQCVRVLHTAWERGNSGVLEFWSGGDRSQGCALLEKPGFFKKPGFWPLTGFTNHLEPLY